MRINRIMFFIGIILIQGCTSTSNDMSKNISSGNSIQKPKNNPLGIEFNQDFDFENIKSGHIKDGTDYVISKAEKIKIEIIKRDDDKRTYENTLVRIDEYIM